jgi:tRNA-modifying protein YgfZ
MALTPVGLTPVDERVVAVTGPDRYSFLDATTSQLILASEPAGAGATEEDGVVPSAGALVLDANGGPLAMFATIVLADRILLVTPDAAVAATVLDVLGGRTFLAEASFVPLDDRVLVLHGDGARDAATGLLAAAGSSAVVASADAHGMVRFIGDAPALATIVAQAERMAITLDDGRALEELRIARGVPQWGHEVAPPHLPEELGLLPTHVHLAKGCYPGQEAVARMWMLGRPRRRLAVLHTVGPVVPGWTVGTGRDEVVVTSVAPLRGLALGFVPGATTVGSTFEDGQGATVEVLRLPGDDPVPPGHDPRMTRRRDRDAAPPVTRVRRPE